MTDAEVIQAVASWCDLSQQLRHEVRFEDNQVRFHVRRGAHHAGALFPREAMAEIERAAFEGVRIGLDFALSTSRAAAEIAGGFSRS